MLHSTLVPGLRTQHNLFSTGYDMSLSLTGGGVRSLLEMVLACISALIETYTRFRRGDKPSDFDGVPGNIRPFRPGRFSFELELEPLLLRFNG